MYSIFSTKSKKLNYLQEGEPPPKKHVTESDTFIKELTKNQLKTNITLMEQLSQQKEFTTSETFTDVTAYISGKTELEDFKANVSNTDELNKLKSKGLTDNDIKIYREHLDLGPEFWIKYKDVNKDVLERRLHEIIGIINILDESSDSEQISSTSRHQEEYFKSLKPQSVETKLLKFAEQNRLKNHHLPGPMDMVPDLEKQLMHDIEEFSKCDIKKIRKKARALSNKVKDLIEPQKNVEIGGKLQRKTKWDVKEQPEFMARKVEIIDKDKVYTCKPQNWYTIKDGEIIKLNEDKTIPEKIITDESCGRTKLSLEELKNIPKFSNYETGNPSKTLFLKNLGKKCTEEFLTNLLAHFEPGSYRIKIMNGKMKGQAFLEFPDEFQAAQGLESLNGTLVEGRPIVAQFGKKK